MKMMKTNIILEKKSKFDPWYMLANGAHKGLQDTLDEAVQTSVKDNPNIDTEGAEELTDNKLEPRYRSEIIDHYRSFLAISKPCRKIHCTRRLPLQYKD